MLFRVRETFSATGDAFAAFRVLRDHREEIEVPSDTTQVYLIPER